MTDFFDFRARLHGKPARPAVPSIPAGEPLTVGQVTRLVDKVVRAGTPASLAVLGEVSNYSHNVQSGHAYFTLKDATDRLHCVMFKDHFDRLKFAPANGLELVATGNLQVYGAQGRHQLYVQDLQPVGHGALELAFQQLRRKLEAEGLFDPAGRKPIPRYPQRIAIVTSRQTAALQDILRTLAPARAVRLFLSHVPVQGDGSGPKIAEAIRSLNKSRAALGGIDLIVLARGGGSYEDLWGFNDESLARAVRASAIPVVTGIGHDTDVSIADLAADHHAHTPTQAAAVSVRHWLKAVELLNGTAVRLSGQMRAIVTAASHQLAGVERHEVFRRPVDLVHDRRALLDDRERAIAAAIDRLAHRAQMRLQRDTDRLARFAPGELLHRHRERIDTLLARLAFQLTRRIRVRSDQLASQESRLAARHPAGLVRLLSDRINARAARLARAVTITTQRRGDQLTALSSQLEALSPQRILERGYSITTLKKTGQPIRAAGDVKEPDRIVTRFADGLIESVVEDAKRPKLFE
jgi:exodeoxyribonuclease VII large subunit